MPLTLILGRVGCSKTAYAAEEICRRIDRNGENQTVTVIVPDQYTVATERYFLDRIGEKRSRHLNVTSLKSLARTKFAEYGVPARFLGEGGKTVLLKKAFDAVSPSLQYYPPDYRNPRFLALVLGAIKEMKAAGISADDLMDTARKTKNGKLLDLAMIRQVYEGYLSEGYFDPEDAPARLRDLLESTGDFENEAVYAVNFRTFYNRERKILLQMVKNGADVTVILPTDTVDPEKAGPTADSAEEAKKLTAYCRREGEECRIINLQEKASFSSEEFALLEGEYADPAGKISREAPERIHLYRGSDRFDEAEYAASVIARKVRDEGYRYSDFTLIVRSLEDYAGVLDPVFSQYDIPLFYHRKTPLRQRNPIPMIASLFSMAAEGYSRDAVVSFVKSGFVCTPEQASWFERYVDVWTVRYNRFETPFTRPIGGYVEKETEEDLRMREGAEAVRRKVIGTAERFKQKTRNADVRGISTALYETLEELNVAGILEQNSERYRRFGEYELAARQRKVYEQLILALDEMVLTAGADPVSLKEYRDLFFAVIDTHDVAILPTSLDEVTAGSPETLPMISPRCVFILGLNEGVFPRNIDDNRLLTDKDREELADFEIGETTDDKIRHEMFYIYLSLTAPREELYLSYAAVIGGEAAPSAVVHRMREIFPGLKEESFRADDPELLARRIQSERAAFALHTRTPVEELGDYFKEREGYAELLTRREESALTPQTARKIYADDLYVSASRADKYHQCQYAYFLRYGIEVSPWRKAELDPANRGNIVHEALEAIIAEGLDCTDEELHQRVSAFGEAKLKQFYGDETPPATVKSYFEALMKKIERLLKLFRKEFEHSKFRPFAFEQGVGVGDDSIDPIRIPLDRGTLSMTGVVDRIDLYEQDGTKYIRVVDYKTGEKKFSFDLVAQGIDIQMLMYLYALQQNLFPGQASLPAGVQYIGSNPKTSAGKRSLNPETVMLQWEDETPRTGVFLKDPAILSAMDDTETWKFLKLKKNSDGFLMTAEEFGRKFEEITELLKKMGNALHQGQTAKNPKKIGSLYNSCERCDLKDYCHRPEIQEIPLAEKKISEKKGGKRSNQKTNPKPDGEGA